MIIDHRGIPFQCPIGAIGFPLRFVPLMISERLVRERNANGSFVFFLKPLPTDNVFRKTNMGLNKKPGIEKRLFRSTSYLMNAKDHPKARNRTHGLRI